MQLLCTFMVQNREDLQNFGILPDRCQYKGNTSIVKSCVTLNGSESKHIVNREMVCAI